MGRCSPVLGLPSTVMEVDSERRLCLAAGGLEAGEATTSVLAFEWPSVSRRRVPPPAAPSWDPGIWPFGGL